MKITDSHELVRGAARMSDLTYVITKQKQHIAQSVAQTTLLGIDAGRWGALGFDSCGRGS